MGPQWTLLLTFFSCWKALGGIGGKTSSDGTYHQDTLLGTGVRLVSPYTPLLLTTDEGQRELVYYESNDRYITYASQNYWTDLSAVPTRSINTMSRTEKIKTSTNIQEKHNTRNDSKVPTSGAPLSQVLGAVDHPELRDSPVVMAHDAGDSQPAVLSLSQVLGAVDHPELRDSPVVMAHDAGDSQPAVLQHMRLESSPREVVQINTLEDVLKMGLDYHLLFDGPNLLHTKPSNYPDSSRRRRRSPAAGGGTYCDNCFLALAAGGGTYCDNCSLALSLARKVDQDLTLGDLLLYLISLTSGRQLYLVYDDVTPGVEVVVRSFQEVLGDTTLLPYDPNILLLTEVLTSNYHVQAMRNVFILCSATHLYNLFEQVRDKVLESPTIHWIVIVDEDLTEELPLLLREGTQVALVQRVTPQEAQLLSSRVDPDGQVRFHRVGSWSVSGTLRTDNHQVKGGLLPDLQQLYSDFQGRQLSVSSNNNWPFFKIKSLENGTVVPISGVDYSVINTLSEELNFTYQVVRPPDGSWGGPQPDGTVTGLVGQVARREAHVSLCELTITGSRETVVDFTVPYYFESTTLASLAPKEKNRSFAVFSPFTVRVWLCICLVTVLVGPLLYLVTRLLVLYVGEEDTAQYSLQSFSFNMYRNLVVQGNLITSHRWSLRFIFLSWYLFCFYIYALYSGTLTAVLAVVSFERPIDSLHDLAQARRQGYTIGTIRDSSFVEAFKTAKSGIYREVWQLFNHEEPDQSFVSDVDIGIDRVLETKFIFISSRLNSKLNAAQRGRDKFHIGRQTFLPQGSGIAFSSGSPYRESFSSIVTRLTEAGLLYKWANDEVNKVSKYTTASGDPGPTAINLQHLQAAFFIMALGFAIATTLLVMEIVVIRWWPSVAVEVVIQLENLPSQRSQTPAGTWFSKRFLNVHVQ